MLVSDIISASLRKIGALSSGETIESTRQQEALKALQSMLRSWGSLSFHIVSSTKESATLSSGIESYTWGTGGSINSARPSILTGAYILQDGVSSPVDIITESVYRDISVKLTPGRPYAAFLHSTYPLATLYVYPVPDAVYTIYLDSFKPFTETSSFTLVTDTIAFPGVYEEPIIYNLAVRLAPEYGRSVPAEVVAIAASSYNDLIKLNAGNRIEPVKLCFPADYRYSYSVDTDAYR